MTRYDAKAILEAYPEVFRALEGGAFEEDVRAYCRSLNDSDEEAEAVARLYQGLTAMFGPLPPLFEGGQSSGFERMVRNAAWQRATADERREQL